MENVKAGIVQKAISWKENLRLAKGTNSWIGSTRAVLPLQLSWGKPTRLGPVELQTLSLDEVKDIRLLVNKQPVDFNSPPSKGSVALEFELDDGSNSVKIPFTEIPLAAQWAKVLQQDLEK